VTAPGFYERVLVSAWAKLLILGKMGVGTAMSDNTNNQPATQEKPESGNFEMPFLMSAIVAFVCIALLSGYSYLTFEFDIPSHASLMIGLIITAIFWKHRKTRGMLNGLFTCGVVISGISVFVSLLNWFA